MSISNVVTASQLSIATVGRRPVVSQTAEQPPSELAASSATISQAARDLAAQENRITISSNAPHGTTYMQHMAEKFAGLNQQRAMMANDPSNPLYAEWLDGMAQQNFSTGTGEDALLDISGTVPGGDGILRYSSGEPVTTESQAYQTQQVNSYKQAALELYNSEMTKGTPPGDIIIKIMDLQEQQPARFRAMMMWPTAADFATNQPDATSGGVKS